MDTCIKESSLKVVAGEYRWNVKNLRELASKVHKDEEEVLNFKKDNLEKCPVQQIHN
jgi:hypothetical protein